MGLLSLGMSRATSKKNDFILVKPLAQRSKVIMLLTVPVSMSSDSEALH